MASSFGDIPSLPGLPSGTGQLSLGQHPKLPITTSVDIFPPASQPETQASDKPGEKPGKRKRDDEDYKHGSDYYHNLFDIDRATEKGLDDPDAILQERMAQEVEKAEWQEEHDRLVDNNKKSKSNDSAPANEKSVTGSPSPPRELDPETSLHEEIDRTFLLLIEKLKRTDPIRRAPIVAPTKTVTDKQNGIGDTKQTAKGVEFTLGVVNSEDSAEQGNPQEPVATVAKPPTEAGTRRRRTERFRPHPKLPRTDQDFEEAICLLKRMMTEWTREYFFRKLDESEKQEFNLYELSQQSPHLIDYAGWIAAGGDMEKWRNQFVGWRALLVFGILGKMLEVHVFGHTMFGATSAQLETLEAMDLQLLNVDGFKRTKVRSQMIKTLLDGAIVPPRFNPQVRDLTIRFFTMVLPLIPRSVAADLWIPTKTSGPFLPTITNGTNNNANNNRNPFVSTLWSIIDHAAKISLDMRREETIYYVTSPAKNTIFDDAEMSCLNKSQIKRRSNWKEDGEVPLVRIVGFPGIVAYRPGNGMEGGEEKGYRMRRVAKAEVVLEWGMEKVIQGNGNGNGNGNGSGDGNNSGHSNGTGINNGNGNRHGNGNGNRRELTLKEAVARSKPSLMALPFGFLRRMAFRRNGNGNGNGNEKGKGNGNGNGKGNGNGDGNGNGNGKDKGNRNGNGNGKGNGNGNGDGKGNGKGNGSGTGNGNVH
ncbi:MAG: hypothetical protein M1830_003800 [Pleopsidium flavum]|nr:MAG: hypothetical protein M1830_003800 [Pleopsidium flavum]